VKRLRFSLILLIELCVFVRLLSLDPLYAGKLRRLFVPDPQTQQLQYRRRLMREDPTVGRQAPFVERSPLKEVLEPSTLTILVFAGECRPCIEPQLYEWQDLQAKFSEVKIVLGAQNSAKDIAKQRANMKLTLPIGADPDGQMAHAYNAVWSPRAYGIASDGTLAWIQDEPRMSAAGVAPRFLNQRR
jgi:hypothetical protein